MHESSNLATFNATTCAQLISKEESTTQERYQDFAPADDVNGWKEYFSKSAELGMTPLSVIYALEGLIVFFYKLEYIFLSKLLIPINSLRNVFQLYTMLS